jgi:hypothetical protein
MMPRARNREHETTPSRVEDKLPSLLASSAAYERFGDCDEAVAALVLEELAPYHLMFRYIEAKKY